MPSKCCCCFSLNTGANLIGIIQILGFTLHTVQVGLVFAGYLHWTPTFTFTLYVWPAYLLTAIAYLVQGCCCSNKAAKRFYAITYMITHILATLISLVIPITTLLPYYKDGTLSQTYI